MTHEKATIECKYDLPEGCIIKLSDGKYRIVGKRVGTCLELHKPKWHQSLRWELRDVFYRLFCRDQGD